MNKNITTEQGVKCQPKAMTIGSDFDIKETEAIIWINGTEKIQVGAQGYSSCVPIGQEKNLFTDKAKNRIYFYDEKQGPCYKTPETNFEDDFFVSDLLENAKKLINEYAQSDFPQLIKTENSDSAQ